MVWPPYYLQSLSSFLDRSLPAVVSAAKRFVHKETEESLIEMQARIPETDLVCMLLCMPGL